MPRNTPLDNALAQTHYEHATDHLKATMLEYMANYKYVYEKRLQNAMYWLDFNYALEHDEPYTDATYYNYMHGAFSPEIRHLLTNLDLETDKVRRNRGYRTKYLTYGVPRDNPLTHSAVVEWAHDNTRSLTTGELIDKNTNHSVYTTTDFGHELDLTSLTREPTVVTGGRQRGPAPHETS